MLGRSFFVGNEGIIIWVERFGYCLVSGLGKGRFFVCVYFFVLFGLLFREEVRNRSVLLIEFLK